MIDGTSLFQPVKTCGNGSKREQCLTNDSRTGRISYQLYICPVLPYSDQKGYSKWKIETRKFFSMSYTSMVANYMQKQT